VFAIWYHFEAKGLVTQDGGGTDANRRPEREVIELIDPTFACEGALREFKEFTMNWSLWSKTDKLRYFHTSFCFDGIPQGYLIQLILPHGSIHARGFRPAGSAAV